jgi:hypothetical protein
MTRLGEIKNPAGLQVPKQVAPEEVKSELHDFNQNLKLWPVKKVLDGSKNKAGSFLVGPVINAREDR